MPLGDHLEELRRRLIFAFLGLLPIFGLSLAIAGPMIRVLTAPLEVRLAAADLPVRVIQTSPTESFGAYIKVALVLTIIVGLPWMFYQFWLFISPGLLPREKRFIHLLIPASGFLSALGAGFMYLVMLPVVLSFFITFSLTLAMGGPGADRGRPGGGGEGLATESELVAQAALLSNAGLAVLSGDPPSPTPGQMWVNSKTKELRIALSDPASVGTDADAEKPIATNVLGVPLRRSSFIQQEYRIREYLSFVLALGLAFAVAFQMPVVVVLLGWVGLVTPAWLGKVRKPAIMVCSVLGAVLTPADPLSMILLAVPLYGLYELGVLALRLLPASKVFKDKREAAYNPDEGDDDGHWPSPFDTPPPPHSPPSSQTASQEGPGGEPLSSNDNNSDGNTSENNNRPRSDETSRETRS